jgi:hypothetical protein
MGEMGKRIVQKGIGKIPQNKVQRKTRFILTLVTGTSINVSTFV